MTEFKYSKKRAAAAVRARKLMNENLRRGEKSRGLMKARITALTAQMSLLESEVLSIFQYLGVPDNVRRTVVRSGIKDVLLRTAEVLGEEE